jgi:hypothetical protein
VRAVAAVATLASLAVLAVLAGCGGGGGGEAAPTMATALEAVPLRRTGGQVVEVQLARRQPSTGVCEPLAGAQVRIRDQDLTVTVPDTKPVLPAGVERIVPYTLATYVVAPDGAAASWLDRTFASGPEDDVVAFVGVDLSRTSSVGAARAVTRLVRVLDEADVYAAVVRGPAGPPDAPGEDAVWTARGVTPDGRVLTVRAAATGPVETTVAAPLDPCAYRDTPAG